MKRSILRTTGLLLVALFTASFVCAQTDAEYKAKIEKLNKEMVKDMLEGNTDHNLSLYTPDAISLPSYEPMMEGTDAIRKSSEDMKKSGMKITAFETNTYKVMSAGNLVNEIGTYKMTMTMPGMSKPMNDHGKYLTIWEKQKDGSLKIKVETWNTDVNPMSMMSTSENK